jgi:uncharacterized protein (UPF0335 family)/polyhydroxyalkanoate synthesis regulator phasin
MNCIDRNGIKIRSIKQKKIDKSYEQKFTFLRWSKSKIILIKPLKMRVCLILALILPAASYDWFSDFGSDEDFPNPPPTTSVRTPTTSTSTTTTTTRPSTPSTTTQPSTPSTTTVKISSEISTTTRAPVKTGPSTDVIIKTLLHGLFSRLEKIEEEVSDLKTSLNDSYIETRAFNGKFSVVIGKITEKLEFLNEMTLNVSANHLNLEKQLNEISNITDLTEKRLSKDMEDLFRKIREEVGLIDIKLEKNLNLTDEISEGPIMTMDGDVKNLGKQLKKIEMLTNKIIRLLNRKSDVESPISSKIRFDEYSDRFVIVFTSSIAAAMILTAFLSGLVVFCTYKHCARRQNSQLPTDDGHARVGETSRVIQIVHPHQYRDDGDDVAQERTRAFVEDIARRRQNNETLESDPLNIEREDRQYEEVPSRSNEDRGAVARAPYVNPLRRLLPGANRVVARIEVNAERRRAFLQSQPPNVQPPPPPPPRVIPPPPDQIQMLPINPPDLGLRSAPLQDLSDL